MCIAGTCDLEDRAKSICKARDLDKSHRYYAADHETKLAKGNARAARAPCGATESSLTQ